MKAEDYLSEKAIVLPVNMNVTLVSMDDAIEALRLCRKAQGEQKPVDNSLPKYNKGDILTDGKSTYKVLSWDYTEKGIAAYYIEGNGCKFSWLCNEVDEKLKPIEQKPDDKSKIKSKFKTGDRVIGIVSGMPYFITEVCDDHYNTESGCIIMFCSQDNFELYEQNPDWSEEDELHIRELEGLVKQVWAIAEHENHKDTIHKMSDLSFFLKTLKPQLKQEWSEDDKNMLNDILICGEHHCYLNAGNIAWLKSLRPQNRWKPSDEQMEALRQAAYEPEKNWSEELQSLYYDIKKL